MTGKLVWIDTGEIKNPTRTANYRYGFSQLYDAQAKSFDNGVKAALVHEVDIDKLLQEFLDCRDMPHLDKKPPRKTFSQFLTSKLDTQKGIKK